MFNCYIIAQQQQQQMEKHSLSRDKPTKVSVRIDLVHVKCR